MAKRSDPSRSLGGMSGQAASALRGRGRSLNDAISAAEGAPSKKRPAPRNAVKNKKR